MRINKFPIFCVIASLILLVSYIILFGKYRPAEIDDAWTASYVWNLTHKGTTDDLVFGGVPSNIKYFGHIHARIAAQAADAFGWTKATFHLLNLLCMAASALAWFAIARKLLNSNAQALVFILLLFLLEPFIGGAYKARSDAMAFMLMSWGTAFAVYRHYLAGALLVSIAIEIHAVSCVGYFLIAALLLVEAGQAGRQMKKMLGPVLGTVFGCLLGFWIYRYLHPEPLSEVLDYLLNSNAANMGENSFNALTSHYFGRKYYRFIPELLFWITGAGVYFWRTKTVFSFNNKLILFFWATILASVLIHRGNFHYIIFFYPPLFLLAFKGFLASGFHRPAFAALALYASLLSAVLFQQNRHVDHRSFDAEVAQMFEETEQSTAAMPIIGPYNAWFALRKKNFYCRYSAMQDAAGNIPHKILYIASRYTEPLPDCAKPVSQIDRGFIFNRGEVSLWEFDLSQCPGKN